MRDKKTIQDLAIKFLNKYHPECICAMISGSFVEKYFNETSDVDILLISKLPETIFIESYNFQGIEFQTIVLPYNNIIEIIAKEINNGEGIYLSIIAKGVIIKDTRDYLLKLKDFALDKYKQGPAIAKPYDIIQLRARITSRMLDLKGSSSYSDNLFVIIDTFQKIITLHSKYHRIWLQSSKYASRLLEKVDPEFKNDLVNSFSDFVLTKDTQTTINFFEKYLDIFGGKLNYFSTREVIDEIKDDQLVIYIKNYELENLLPDILLPYHEYILSRIYPLNFIICKSERETLSEQGVYIIIKRENKFLNEHILPLTKNFISNIYYKSKIKYTIEYPFSINPIALSYPFNVQDIIYPVLSEVSNYFAKKYKNIKFNDISSINDGLSVISTFKIVFKFTNEHFSLFLNYIFDYYLPYSYNIEDNIPYNMLEERRIKIYEEFEIKSKKYSDYNTSILNKNNNEYKIEKFITDKLLEYDETLKMKYKNKEIFIADFELSLLPQSINIETRYLWVMYRKLLTNILNSLFIKNKYKSYIVYIMLKKKENEFSS